ncbi:MAG TPA: hypothetical protein VF039_09345 [Longimicrobiales bacterium]
MKLARTFTAIMAITAVAACDDNGTGPDDSLEGSYTVSGFTYTPDSGGAGVNLAALTVLGCPCGILSMDVDSDNHFEGQLKYPGQDAMTIAGDIDTDGNQITIDFDEATETTAGLEDESGTFTTTSSGGLTITLPEVTFDFRPFGGEGPDEPATLVIVAAEID